MHECIDAIGNELKALLPHAPQAQSKRSAAADMQYSLAMNSICLELAAASCRGGKTCQHELKIAS